MSPAANRFRAQTGSASVGSVFGVAIFLGFLMLSSQVLIHLYAASTITAVAFDAARRASGEGGDCATAQHEATARLGSWSDAPDVTVACSVVGDSTEVTISGPSPARSLTLFGRSSVDQIERGARFRTETVADEDGS